MKIIDWISGKLFKLETMEIEERDDIVIIPAWQFALFVHEYKERGRSISLAFIMVLLLCGIFLVIPLLK